MSEATGSPTLASSGTGAPKVTLVVAATRNGIIGRAGDMPWRMPSSLKRFRSLTMGRPMIMGRKTYRAIGRPLDGRDTIVVTRDPGFAERGVHRAGSLEEAFVTARALAASRVADEIVIAGGGEIYAAALPYATDVQLDLIETEIDGDTEFPALDARDWQEVCRGPIPPHPRDDYPATAIHFCRIGAPRSLPSA